MEEQMSRTYAVETSSDTYFVSADNEAMAREMMGWTFDHDGIEDREILSVTLRRRIVQDSGINYEGRGFDLKEWGND
jgi:hypothetical protein